MKNDHITLTYHRYEQGFDCSLTSSIPFFRGERGRGRAERDMKVQYSAQRGYITTQELVMYPGDELTINVYGSQGEAHEAYIVLLADEQGVRVKSADSREDDIDVTVLAQEEREN